MTAAPHATPIGRPMLAPDEVATLRTRALVAGIAGLAASTAGAFISPERFNQSYLTGYVFVLGIALGCHAIWLLQHMTRGAWGIMIRRILEASARTVPFFAIAFLPLVAGMKSLYRWADPDAVTGDHILEHQAAYLNVPFFLVRVVLYFLIWSGFTYIFGGLSKRQDQAAGAADSLELSALERRMQMLAGPGVIAYILAMTFASIDWVMSVNTHWFSTIFGLYVIAGQAVAGLAFAIVAARFLSDRQPMADHYQPRHFHDYGKLLLAFVMLWSYFAISQFLIIWSGDLPEEISFFKPRVGGGWGTVAIGLVLFHFALPFVLLLSRDRKRSIKSLSLVAVLVLVMRWVDTFWLVIPAFHPTSFSLHWLDLTVPIGLGGVFVYLFLGQLTSRALLPVNDPHLPAALEVVHGH